jgi:hypothetical protein
MVVDESRVQSYLGTLIKDYIAAVNQYSKHSFAMKALRQSLPPKQIKRLNKDTVLLDLETIDRACLLASAKTTLSLAATARSDAKNRLVSAINDMDDAAEGAWDSGIDSPDWNESIQAGISMRCAFYRDNTHTPIVEEKEARNEADSD